MTHHRVTKLGATPAGRSLRLRVLEVLTAQPQTLTQIGAQTGYDWHQLQDVLRKLRMTGRARWANTGWVRGDDAAR